MPAGGAPGVRGGRRRSCRRAPARSLGAGLTAGARTHAGTRSAQSPGRPRRRASFTNPEGRTALPSRRLQAPSPLCRSLLLQLPLRRPPEPGPSESPAFPLPQVPRLPHEAPFRFWFPSLSHHRKTAVRRLRLPGRTLSQSGSVRLSRHGRPEGQRVKESMVTRVSPALPRSDGSTDHPALRRR